MNPAAVQNVEELLSYLPVSYKIPSRERKEKSNEILSQGDYEMLSLLRGDQRAYLLFSTTGKASILQVTIGSFNQYQLIHFGHPLLPKSLQEIHGHNPSISFSGISV